MSGLRAFLSRFFATLHVDRGHDLDEEVRAHIEMQAQEYEREGMTPGEALALALQRFGPVEHVKNQYRDRRLLPWLEAVLRDIRYSARLLRRHPGFALMAFLTLAIGIGATTAVFSLVNRAVLQPLPVDRPHDLVSLSVEGPRRPSVPFAMDREPLVSYPNYLDLRDRAGVFAGLIAYRFTPISVSSGGVNERLWGYMVSGNYFDVLGVRPAAGRTISRSDDAERAGEPVAVISYRFWQARFGGDGAAVGRTIVVNGRGYTIVGVAPRGFFGTEAIAAPDLWFPLAIQPQLEYGSPRLYDRGATTVLVIGRLAPGVTRPQAAAALSVVSAELAREFPDVNEGKRVVPGPPGLFGGAMRGPVLGFGGLLLGIAGLVLLLACVNLANLLLARAIDRRHEVAVRLSIGAGRRALVRQLLIESLMLSMVAGAAGLVLAWWLMQAAGAIKLPVDLPVVLDFPIDGRVLLFNVLLSILTAVMFGLVPALQATKADIAAVLKDSALANERHSVAWRNALIVVQVAVSLVLLTGAGLMWRALGQTRMMPLGFSTAGAFEVSFDLRLQGYTPEQGRRIQRRLIEAVRALPGITHAGVADVVPIDLHFGRGGRMYTDESVAEREVRAPTAYISRITPGYLETMRTRLEEGRDFTEYDNETSALVAIVNRSLARRLWPKGSAIGRRLRLRAPDGIAVEVVGVVQDGKYASFNENGAGAVFRPLAQWYSGSTTIVARTNADISAGLAAVRGVVREVDPNMPIASARSLEERLTVPLLPARVTALALASFGGLALVLAAIGLYGVMSYSVSSRTHEIGVRMALGAQRGDVLRLVFVEGSRLVGVGIVLGIGAAVLATRLMRALLFGVSPTDPITYASVVTALAGVALMACWVPARRAVRTNPLDTLRSV